MGTVPFFFFSFPLSSARPLFQQAIDHPPGKFEDKSEQRGFSGGAGTSYPADFEIGGETVTAGRAFQRYAAGILRNPESLVAPGTPLDDVPILIAHFIPLPKESAKQWLKLKKESVGLVPWRSCRDIGAA